MSRLAAVLLAVAGWAVITAGLALLVGRAVDLRDRRGDR